MLVTETFIRSFKLFKTAVIFRECLSTFLFCFNDVLAQEHHITGYRLNRLHLSVSLWNVTQQKHDRTVRKAHSTSKVVDIFSQTDSISGAFVKRIPYTK